MITYAQTIGNQSTNSGSWTPIPGLAFKLPQGVDRNAMLILNVPNPWATGNNFPGGNFGILVDGQLQGPTASFTYDEQVPPGTGRVPTTLCMAVALSQTEPLPVEAVWCGIRGSTVHLDSPASLTALID